MLLVTYSPFKIKTQRVKLTCKTHKNFERKTTLKIYFLPIFSLKIDPKTKISFLLGKYLLKSI